MYTERISIDNLIKEKVKSFLKGNGEFDPIYEYIKSEGKKYLSYLGLKNLELLDVLDSSIEKCYFNLNTFNFSYPFITWIRKIMLNEFLRYRKNKMRHIRIDELDLLPKLENLEYNEVTISSLEEREKKYKLLKNCLPEVISRLKPKFKDILYDRFINKIKYKDIAKKYNLNINTVKSRIRLGRKYLIKELKKLGIDIRDDDLL